MGHWIAMGLSGTEFIAFSLENGEVTGRAHGVNEAEALAGLSSEADQIIRIGEGSPATVPCAILPESGAGLPVITQDNPPDVLNAWLRLRIAGYLACHKNWDGVIWAIEADISSWIHVSADEIISFASFLTPRLVAALKGADEPSIEAITDTISRPERLASHLRQAETGHDLRAITGHLIGAELAATRPYWLGQQVALITPDGEAPGYTATLKSQGVPADVMRAEEALALGLKALGSR